MYLIVNLLFGMVIYKLFLYCEYLLVIWILGRIYLLFLFRLLCHQQRLWNNPALCSTLRNRQTNIYPITGDRLHNTATAVFIGRCVEADSRWNHRALYLRGCFRWREDRQAVLGAVFTEDKAWDRRQKWTLKK